MKQCVSSFDLNRAHTSLFFRSLSLTHPATTISRIIIILPHKIITTCRCPIEISPAYRITVVGSMTVVEDLSHSDCRVVALLEELGDRLAGFAEDLWS